MALRKSVSLRFRYATLEPSQMRSSFSLLKSSSVRSCLPRGTTNHTSHKNESQIIESCEH
jgi:hypothetical protein